MTGVLHFVAAIGESDRAACGERIFLCNDATDDRRHVDCGRCKRTKAFATHDPRRFDVDVWDHEGDVIRWFRSVSADEVESIRKEYADNPSVSVEVTDR
jgi:hypothetical protein